MVIDLAYLKMVPLVGRMLSLTWGLRSGVNSLFQHPVRPAASGSEVLSISGFPGHVPTALCPLA